MHDMQAFKTTAIEAIKEAEKIILYYFHNLPKIETKVDMTPVTKADKEAEQIIINTIKNRFPTHGFFGEEFGANNDEAEFVWYIDPIDGTKSFVHGLKFYGTVLGLRHKGKIILGISNMPSEGELLLATTDEPTTLNGAEVHVSSIGTMQEALITAGGFSDLKQKPYLDAILEIEQKVMTMRGYGDVYGYHLVATGRADAMFEAVTKPWDISAFQIIIKQAGGKYSDFTGNELALGPSSLATNGLLHQPMLEILKGVI